MIRLERANLLARWFVWCCDHLPLTVTREYGDGKPGDGLRRSGAYYLGNGTTLCHLFWAMLWVPLLIVSITAGFTFLFATIHIGVHDEIVRRNDITSTPLSLAAYFVPEAFVIGCIVLAAMLIFMVLGASKSGFFGLLWPYLKGLKQRVCPLVRFDSDGRPAC